MTDTKLLQWLEAAHTIHWSTESCLTLACSSCPSVRSTVRPPDRRVRPSDRPCVRPWDRPPVRPSVRPSVRPPDRPRVRSPARPSDPSDRSSMRIVMKCGSPPPSIVCKSVESDNVCSNELKRGLANWLCNQGINQRSGRAPSAKTNTGS